MAAKTVIACAQCGTKNISNRVSCISCHSELPADEKAQGAKWWGDIDSDSLWSLAIYIGCVVGIPVWLTGKWGDLGILVQLYLAGMILFWVYYPLWFFTNFVRTFSIFDRNMAQLGMRRNIFVGVMQEKQSVSYSENLWFATINVLMISLLSWLILLRALYILLKRIAYRWRTPKAIKEIEWTLKHHLLAPLDVARFDAKMAETLLGRRLTQEESDSRQRQFDRNDVDVKMSEVIALNSGEGISERPHSRHTTKNQQANDGHHHLTENVTVCEPAQPVLELDATFIEKLNTIIEYAQTRFERLTNDSKWTYTDDSGSKAFKTGIELVNGLGTATIWLDPDNCVRFMCQIVKNTPSLKLVRDHLDVIVKEIFGYLSRDWKTTEDPLSEPYLPRLHAIHVKWKLEVEVHIIPRVDETFDASLTILALA